MRVLQSGLTDAIASRGRLVLLSAEPGMGKTRTCEELALVARDAGARVLWGRCYEGEGAPAFWPWVQVIRAATRSVDPDSLRGLLGAGAADIAQVVPELRERLPDLPVAGTIEAASARFRVFDGITRLLERLAHQTPLVLVFDDLQGADPSSLLLLQFVVRHIQEMPMLIAGTCREAALHSQQALAETFAEALRASGTERVTLSGLGETDIARYVELATGQPPAAELVSSLHKHTEGNPLFVIEFVRALAANGDLRGAIDPSLSRVLPEGVKAVIRRRLAGLPACHEALSVASVIGRAFSLDVLAASLDGRRMHMHPPAAPAAGDIRRWVEEAVAAGVLSRSADAADGYRFSHALIRETLYDDLEPARRAALHRVVGEAIEGLYAGDLDAHLPALAHHFRSALPDVDRQKTISYCQRAGERALALLAFEEASVHFSRALETLTATTDHDLTLECQLLLALGDSYNHSGAMSEARPTFLKAAALARKLGAPEQLAMAAVGFGGMFWEEGGVVREREIALLEESLSALGDGDSSLCAKLLSRLAIEVFWSDPDRARALAADAVQMAERIGDMGALAAALDAQHAALLGPTDVAKRLEVATDLIRVGKMLNKSEVTFRGHYWSIIDLLELSDIAQVDVEIDAHARIAEETRLPGHRYWAAAMKAMRTLLDGRFEEAELLTLQAFSLGQQAQEPNTVGALGVQMFVLRWHQGRLGEFEHEIQDFVDRHPRVPAGRSNLALLYCELGRAREADNELQRLAANSFADLPRDHGWLPALYACSEVAAYLNDARCAAILYDLLMPFAGRNLELGTVAVAGSLSHPLGLLAATISQWEAAARHFEDALAMHLKMGARALVARTQYEYGAMLLRDHPVANVSKGRVLLTRALDAASALGMKSLEQKIPALLLVAPEPDRCTTALPPAERLFRREGQYWTVAYDGQFVRLKDSKGVQYLAKLLGRPGQEIPALELAQQSARNAQGADENLGTDKDGLVALDPQAKQEYRQRWRDLRQDLAEAEELNDLGRAGKLKAELDFLTQQLTAAVDLHGKDRKTGAAAERARLMVTKRIKSALKSLEALHPPLAHHLRACVKTGYYCAYTPPPGQAVVWLTSE